MDIKSFKQAHNEEYARRNIYEQDMIKNRQNIQSEHIPFHPVKNNGIDLIQSEPIISANPSSFTSPIELDMIDSPQLPIQPQFQQNRIQTQQFQPQFQQTLQKQQFQQTLQKQHFQPHFQQNLQPETNTSYESQPKYQHKIVPHQQLYQTIPSYKSAPPMGNPQTTPQPFLPQIEEKEAVMPNYSLSSQRPGFYKPNDDIKPVQPEKTPAKAPVQDNKQLVYRAFEMYFNNPSFIKQNDVHDNHSLYYARVQTLLSDPRYIVVISDPDMRPKGTIVSLKDIHWKSFQLRIIEKEIQCPEITYDKTNNGVFDDKIILVRRDKLQEKVIYQCKFNPLTVELLPSKKGSIMDYPEQSTLETAMDSFHCVLYFS